LNAQNKIIGKYIANTQSFETDDKNYWIGFFEQGVARLFKKGYVGLIDTTGKVLCMPKYDKIFPFKDGIALTGLNGKYGLINQSGKELYTPTFKNIGRFSGSRFVFVDVNNKKGIIAKEGSIITKKRYDYISNFKNDFASFKRGKLFGIIDKAGKETTLLDYQNKRKFDKVLFSFDGSYGKEWRLGKLEEHNVLFEFNSGLAVHFKKINDSTYKFGYINSKGKFIISPKYDFARPFINQYAVVKRRGYWGVISTNSKTVIPFLYETIQPIPGDKFIVSKQGQYGIVNSKHKRILRINKPPLVYLFDDLFAIYKNKKWGVINLKGEQILPHHYDGFAKGTNNTGIVYSYAVNFPPIHQSSLFQALYNTCQYSYFNKNGTLKKGKTHAGIILLFQDNIYQKKIPKTVSDFYRISFTPEPDQNIQVKENKQYTIIRSLKGGYMVVGKEVEVSISKRLSIFGEYQNVLESSYYRSKIPMKRYKQGLVDNSGSFLIPVKYDLIAPIENLLIVKKSEKWGVLNLKNEVILPIEYDSVTFASGVLIVGKGTSKNGEQKIMNKQAIFDHQGKILIPFKNVVYHEGVVGRLFSKSQTKHIIIDKSKID